MITLILFFGLVTSPKVIQVFDGDTILMKTTDGFDVRGRLMAIDCPEVAHKERRGKKKQPGQPLGEEARERLRALLHQEFSVKTYGNDAFGRSLIEVVLKDQKIANVSLVEEGLCEVYRKGNKKKLGFSLVPYEKAESRAKAAKKGIWGLSHYEPPAVYRKRY